MSVISVNEDTNVDNKNLKTWYAKCFQIKFLWISFIKKQNNADNFSVQVLESTFTY